QMRALAVDIHQEAGDALEGGERHSAAVGTGDAAPTSGNLARQDERAILGLDAELGQHVRKGHACLLARAARVSLFASLLLIARTVRGAVGWARQQARDVEDPLDCGTLAAGANHVA